ncbi:hypothetical protein [Ferruginibacter sp.]|nr:hypothetical protein [Ferruginibacter sp.]
MKCMVAIALLLFTRCAVAQDHIIPTILKQVIKKPVYIVTPSVTEQTIIIPCAFGKAALQIPEVMVDLSMMQVTAIDLVYTDYPSADALTQLNTARLQNIFSGYPGIAYNDDIAWQLIRQTNGAVKDSALKLFHGFVIYYRPLQNKATITTDLIQLKEMLAPKEAPVKRRNGFVAGDTTELRKQYEIEEYTTVLKLPVAEALQFLGIDAKEKIIYKNFDSLYVYLKPSVDSAEKYTLKAPIDSTVLKVLDRMPWNNMLVVTDVTASMYPYSGQLLYWLKLHEDERRIKQFVFFNDGDETDDDKKIMGSTGGVYSTASSVFEVVEQLLFKTMSNGNGGNIPENNIEALLKSSQACSSCESIVMIADNASAVSDMALLQQLNKPVHIILCGVHDAVNIDYLNIALHTGGSIHTAEEDIPLINLKEGEKIIIRGKNYTLAKGKFVAQ